MVKTNNSILNKIQHYCAYQERCHTEVRSKLLDFGVKGTELEDIIAALIQEDFLNEERFANAYVSGKLNIKNWGRNKIIQGLKLKRVSEYCINKAIKNIDATLYFSIAEKVIVKKWESLTSIKIDWKRKQKTTQYALQRGFELNIIQEVLDELIMR